MSQYLPALLELQTYNSNDLVKSHQEDGKVKSSRCKARNSFQAVRRNLEE
jgi:hypothetical protein